MANNQYNFLDYAGLSLFWNNVKSIIEENELATASALTDLDTRVDNVESSKADKGHTHDYLPLSGGTMINPIKFSYNNNGNCNVSRASGFSMFYSGQSDAENKGFPTQYSSVMSFMTEYCGMQLATYGGNDDRLFFRKISDSDVWTPWYTLFHSGNYNSYAPKLDGTGATGTWGINITGNAATAGSATSAGYANEIASKGMLDSQEKIDNFITPNRFEYALFKTTDANNVDFASNDGMIISIPWASDSYGFQMAFDDTRSGDVKVRGKSNSWGDWYTLLHSGNYTTYCKPANIGAAAVSHTHTKSQITDFAHTHTKSQITDFPTSLPASDVYAWAKADTKPPYTGGEVKLTGYSKNNSYTAIESGDSVQAAIAKLEGALSGLEDLLASI